MIPFLLIRTPPTWRDSSTSYVLEVDRLAAPHRVEQTARDLLEAAPDAVVAVDGRGRIALINAAAEQLYGYRRDELVGQPEEMLLPRGAARAACR